MVDNVKFRDVETERYQKKSFLFAIEIVSLYKVLVDRKEFVLSKQLLRSGTSIGANIRESEHAQSKADFIHKLSISLKEANETEYWLDLLFETKFINLIEFENIKPKIIELLKLLTSIIKTSKSK
ncbi:MAG: four helix bundle protein [Flavobacterium sp.]|nr:four helix bundle protein [Flavobacterium sp.]